MRSLCISLRVRNLVTLFKAMSRGNIIPPPKIFYQTFIIDEYTYYGLFDDGI
jgi:hypothetical protein